MKIRGFHVFCGTVSLLALSLCVNSPGTFQTRCLERHFWLSISSTFLGPKIRFDFEDQYGYHILSDQEAALCGYTVLISDTGDLVLRASFLACHVHSQMGTDYRLRVWFVNLQADGNVALYPFQLFCSFQGRWSNREIICEENYMEVSIQLPALTVKSRNDKKEGHQAEMGVMFLGADQAPEEAEVLSLTQAAALHYHISVTGSRLALRCPYSSPLSYIRKDNGVDLDIVSSTTLYQLQSGVLAVDTTVACPLNEVAAEGSDLLWTLPFIVSPLVGGQFRGRGVRFGVNGQTLSESDVNERRYDISLREGRVEVRFPLGAPGGHIKSGVVRGKYSQSVSVDLSFTSEWEDEHRFLSQLRSFKLLRTPLIPQTPVLTRNTDSSEGLFSVTLGWFAPDVSLQRVTVDSGGDLLTWTQSRQTKSDPDLVVSRLSHVNGSCSFHLSFPLSHAKIIPEYIGAGYTTYNFTFIFTLNISPSGEVFYHQATIEHSVEYTGELQRRIPPDWRGSAQRAACRLDWDLVEMGGFVVEPHESYLTVEIPLHSPAMNYEELTLWGLVAGVTVFVVDAESLKVQDTLHHKCTFPARELLVCLPEGKMVAVVDTTHTIPPTHPNRTSLLDPRCVPMETDSARALFSFSLDSCGTRVSTEGNFLVYENQISYNQDFLPLDDPVIHRDSPYRLTIQCRYPTNESSALNIQYPVLISESS